ncbi:hypothetical protein Poli38472_006373 [Pythium oligandrum]|uniref:SAM-dependent MTase RsmB/NOP-type domain-containing protein n=1 Tax=Pythium oligandrum TaxID=41045 RepID=A0A8K1C4V8_PYTOL|nr:hypothetical protein Poli38472_006373 [Pythium oligandrum]|eukprot:TMW56363.1 hypothetical protein Poli38472_006373 [Pythium oligandrum]
MGKRGRRGGGFNRSKKNRGDAGQKANGAWDQNREENYSEWVYSNDNFVKYYQAQEVVAPEEWESFMAYLAKPLPTTFRINNSCAFADRIRERIATDFKFDGLVVDHEAVDPISEMPWYPNNKGFQWSVERRRIRKLPILNEFQKWLIELSDSGSITRQEAVSMIPPLVLGVEPHHKVLDMCAAPGSKTSQLLESLHAQEPITGETPTGMVMANDVDLKRAYMLVHQSKRMGSPALLVTCHEAQHIPYLGGEEEKQNGFFDRILCDAPCSGDGTLRKNPIIWKQWDAKNGLSLHPLQVEIAKRGASLLKVGGYMCYSTCTFNPIENEAVVAEILRWSNGALELVDVTNTLPLLKRRPGKSSWKVLDSELNEYKTHEEFLAPENEARMNPKNRILSTMFPPSEADAAKYNLERCMRCVPQDENTGGFFICLLKKVAPTPELVVVQPRGRAQKREEYAQRMKQAKAEGAVVEEADAPMTEKTEDAVADDAEEATEAVEEAAEEAVEEVEAEEKPQKQRQSRRERRNNTSKGEEYVAFEASQFDEIKNCFGLTPEFSSAQLITRSDEAKAVTFVTKSITMELLEEMKAKKLKVVYTGIKMFERNDLPDGSKTYRLCQMGLSMALPFVTKRKIPLSTRDLQMLLHRQGDLLDYDEFEAPTAKALEEAAFGTVVCLVDSPVQSTRVELNVVLWRGRNSATLMATKVDAAAMLATMTALNLYSPETQKEVEAAKLARQQQKEAQKAAKETQDAEVVAA